MWLLHLAFFPLLLYLLPACIAFKGKKLKSRKKSFPGTPKASSVSDDLSKSPATTTPRSDSTVTKASDHPSDDEDKELYRQLKMDKNQIARVNQLTKQEKDNWKKWTRLNLTKELDRADKYFLDHDCKGLVKNNCKGCQDYLKLIKTLRQYHHKYGSLCPPPPNEEEVLMAVKEIEQRAYWFGLVWNKLKFIIKTDVHEDPKTRQIAGNDKKRRQKLKKMIKDWRKAHKKREKERQKLEKKRLAQLKKEMELKKKKEKEQTRKPGDESLYENMADFEGPASKSQITNCQYENLIEVETAAKVAGPKKEPEKTVDDSKYENLADWEVEKKTVEKTKEEKDVQPTVEEGYESLVDAIGGEPETDKAEDKTTDKEKKPEDKKADIKSPEQKTESPRKLYTAESPENSFYNDN